MNSNNHELAVKIGQMASEILFGLTVGEIIQTVIALILLVTLVVSIKTTRSNTLATEHSIRPVVGANVSPDSVEGQVFFDAQNFTNTDAIGLVVLQLLVDGTKQPLGNPAYEGKQIWYFPAMLPVGGHIEFSGKLKELKVLGEKDAKLELLVFLYYKAWSPEKKKISKGKQYYGPAQKWHYKRSVAKWIPDITSSTQFIPPEPDWDVLEKVKKVN